MKMNLSVKKGDSNRIEAFHFFFKMKILEMKQITYGKNEKKNI